LLSETRTAWVALAGLIYPRRIIPFFDYLRRTFAVSIRRVALVSVENELRSDIFRRPLGIKEVTRVQLCRRTSWLILHADMGIPLCMGFLTSNV
jgi:hypothetical protein